MEQAREGAAAALGQGKEQCWQGGVQQAQESGMAEEAFRLCEEEEGVREERKDAARLGRRRRR